MSDIRLRAFVYNENQMAADKLAAAFWDAGFECWPFSRLEAMALSFRAFPPQLAFLEIPSEREAVQVTMLMASLCPDCRFVAFTRPNSVQPSGPGYLKQHNFEIFVLSPSAEEIVRFAHAAQAQMV